MVRAAFWAVLGLPWAVFWVAFYNPVHNLNSVWVTRTAALPGSWEAFDAKDSKFQDFP